jgi:hypothetical protein
MDSDSPPGIFCDGVDVDQGARRPNASTCMGKVVARGAKMHDVLGTGGM